MIDGDEAGAKEYVKGIIRDLLMNKVDMSLLVVTKVGWFRVVGWLVGLSMGWWVGWLVGLSVANAESILCPFVLLPSLAPSLSPASFLHTTLHT